MAKIRAETLSLELLPAHDDVDVDKDLERLQIELDSIAMRTLAPRTARVIDEIRRERLAR